MLNSKQRGIRGSALDVMRSTILVIDVKLKRCKIKEKRELRTLVVRENGEELEVFEEEVLEGNKEIKCSKWRRGKQYLNY